MDYTIRAIKLPEFKNIYKRIEADFMEGQYAPYEILRQQLQKGTQKGFILLQDQREAAYAICTEARQNDFVLLSLLAVYQEFRGCGLGSAFLDELKKLYSTKSGLIVEVEKSEDALSNQEKTIRERRIQFYHKAGFYLVSNIDYSIWDISMELMVLPQLVSKQKINKEIGQIIYQIYFELLGEEFIHKLNIVMLNKAGKE